MLDSAPYLIAITGGPCAGKSTFLSQAYKMLQEHNIHAIVLPESATELITSNLGPSELGVYSFESHLVEYQLTRESAYLKMAAELMSQGKKVAILCDRGVPDCRAYMTEEHYTAVIGKRLYSPMEMLERYKIAIHLVTAADGAEQFYTCENNEARLETPEDARSKDRATLQAWGAHPHRVIVDNSTAFKDKVRRALCALARVLDMPEPREIERKFKIRNFSPSFIPEDAVLTTITQTYLVTGANLSERRVRVRECNGSVSYTYTEKLPTPKTGERIEYESRISHDEYVRILAEKDLSRAPIVKDRYTFPYKGRQFELDVFKTGRPSREGLVVLEVELEDISATVQFPPEWDLEEKTGDAAYGNYALALP